MIVILLSLMIWGMLWGLIGMVLAVPMTAVLKIQLENVDHPAAAYIVRLLVGGESSAHAADETSLQPATEDRVSLRSGDSQLESASRPLVVPSTPSRHGGDDVDGAA